MRSSIFDALTRTREAFHFAVSTLTIFQGGDNAITTEQRHERFTILGICFSPSLKREEIMLTKKTLVAYGTVVWLLAGPAAAQNPQLVRGLYYDRNDHLLQIEDVSQTNLSGRTLEDVSGHRITVFTSPPSPSAGCQPADSSIPMSNKAKYVVYEAAIAVGVPPQTIQFFTAPFKFERIQGHVTRQLQCPTPPDSTCSIPPHMCGCWLSGQCGPGCCR